MVKRKSKFTKWDSPAKRINIYIPERYFKTVDEIENLSRFVQIALDDAWGIMAYAILKKERPEEYAQRPVDKLNDAQKHKLAEEFNKWFPQEIAIAKKQGIDKTWPKNSDPKRDLW